MNQAKKELIEQGFEDRIFEFSDSTATVKEAASCLHVEEGEIAKTLAFLGTDNVFLIVAAGDQKIDNAKFKNTFSIKAKMLSSDLVFEYTGHKVGGVCPFGLKQKLNVYLDDSLKRFSFVYPACGSNCSAVRLSLEELESLSHSCGWVDVCKNM